MLPGLTPGNIIVAIGSYRRLSPDDIVIINHGGIEKVKRVSKIADGRVYVLGDNLSASTDSRQFGWIGIEKVLAKVILPRNKRQPS